MQLKMKKTLIFFGFTEKSDFDGDGVHEKPISREGLSKKGGLTICKFKGA